MVLYFVAVLLLYLPLPADDQLDLHTFIALLITQPVFPLLGICLFIDAWKVRTGGKWNPSPYLYGLFGILHGLFGLGIGTLSVFVSRDIWGTIDSVPDILQNGIVAVSAIVCLFYLFQRFRYVGFR